MVKETDKAWLAGIIDGEGTFNLYANKGHRSPRPYFAVVNSSLPMMFKCQEVLSEICGKVFQIKPKSTGKSTLKQNLDMYVIEFRKQKYVIDVLNSVLPFLTAKKERAEFVLKMLNGHKRYSTWLDSELDEIFSRGVTTERESPIGVKPQSGLM